MPETAWPAGVVARYRTVGDTTVDVIEAAGRTRADCLGCRRTICEAATAVAAPVTTRAKKHAAACRAVSRPTA